MNSMVELSDLAEETLLILKEKCNTSADLLAVLGLMKECKILMLENNLKKLNKEIEGMKSDEI